ncbi:MAG: glycosyltransferase family 4 protein [Nitrososphaera sp.]
MKRVVFVTKSSAIGGAEGHLADLIMRLDLSMIKVVVLCFGSDSYTVLLKERLKLDIEVHCEREPEGAMGFWLAFRRHDPQVVVFVNCDLGMFPWQAYLAARLSGAGRVVAIEHLIASPSSGENGFGGGVRRVVSWLDRYVVRIRRPGIVCDRTICVSDAVRKRLVDEYEYPERKTITIHNGVDLTHYNRVHHLSDSIREKLKLGFNDELIVCVARLDLFKRIDIVLAAMAIVCWEHRSCKCVIVGDGPLRDALIRKAEELELDSAVVFAGYKEDVRPVLAAADIFVTASEREGLPLSLLEAMAYGLPCISTNIGGNNEVVVHGHNGLMVTPGSVKELAQAIKYLLVHKEERLRMGMNARKDAEEGHNIEDTMARIKSVLFN